MFSSRRPERADGRCSTQGEHDVRMERGCEEIVDGEAKKISSLTAIPRPMHRISSELRS